MFKFHKLILTILGFVIIIQGFTALPILAMEQEGLEDMELVSQNQFMELYFNLITTEFAINHKESGKIWYSNPPDRDEDTIAYGTNKTKLGSQLEVGYYTQSNQMRTMDNYNFSVQYNQFEVVKIENGVRVEYLLGKKTITINDLPQIISKERFENRIIDRLDEKDVSEIKARYSFLSLDDATNEQHRNEMLTKYPSLDNNDIYVLRSIPEFVIDRLYAILERAEYTKDDLAFDNEENFVAVFEEGDVSFFIPIEYMIDGDSFLVKINADEIKFEDNVYLSNISILQYFGAAGSEAEGYIFVPDGSGALINLNNNKLMSNPYNNRLYGLDKSIDRKEITQLVQPSCLPVFGLKQDNYAFFSIIEEGDSHASIFADISGKDNSYNFVGSKIEYMPSSELVIAEGYSNRINLFSKTNYEGDITIRYHFLSGNKANYVGMAHLYQNYLVEKEVLKRLPDNNSIPFYMELIGSVKTRKSFLGIPYNSFEALTTFKQASIIVDELQEEGIENIAVKYTGWFNGGINHKPPSVFRIDRVLGGKRDFIKMINAFEEQNVQFFPDVSFSKAYTNSLNFNRKKHTARFISKDIAVVYPFDVQSRYIRYWEKPMYLISPLLYDHYFNRYLSKTKQYNLQGISLRYLGKELNSDFNEGRTIQRQESQKLIEAQLKNINENNINIMVDEGNGYTLPYVRNILNMPLDHSLFNILDESIPFYQMVIHGFVDYAGEPINLAGNMDRVILKSIETGAGLYFKWMMHSDRSVLVDTEYSDFYSISYHDWKEEAISLYTRYNQSLNDISNQRIINHEKLDVDIYMTTYENGTSVIVNYSNNSFEFQGKVIPANDWNVVER